MVGALRVRIRDEGLLRNNAVCLTIGMDASDCKQVLEPWIEQTAGTKRWLRVMNEPVLRLPQATRAQLAIQLGLQPAVTQNF